MRYRTLSAILLALAVPIAAEAQSLPQQRQHVGYAISRAYNTIDELRELIDRLQTVQAWQTAMVEAGVSSDTVYVVDTVYLPPPDTVVPPPDTTTPPPASGMLGTDLPLSTDDISSFEICPSCGNYSPDPVMRGDTLHQSWEGVPDTWSPRYPYYQLGGARELYVSVDMRFSPGWDWGCHNGWTKWFTVINGQGNAWWGAIGAGGSARDRNFRCRTDTQRFQSGTWGFSDQWISGTTDLPAEIEIPVDGGTWMRLEFYINIDTGRTMAAQDGRIVLDRVGAFAGRVSGLQELKLGSTNGGDSGFDAGPDHWAQYRNLVIRAR